MDFFPLRHGFDLIVKNTFYTVPIEEEEDGRTRGNDGKVGRWDFSLVVGLFSQVYSTGWNRGGGGKHQYTQYLCLSFRRSFYGIYHGKSSPPLNPAIWENMFIIFFQSTQLQQV